MIWAVSRQLECNLRRSLGMGDDACKRGKRGAYRVGRTPTLIGDAAFQFAGCGRGGQAERLNARSYDPLVLQRPDWHASPRFRLVWRLRLAASLRSWFSICGLSAMSR